MCGKIEPQYHVCVTRNTVHVCSQNLHLWMIFKTPQNKRPLGVSKLPQMKQHPNDVLESTLKQNSPRSVLETHPQNGTSGDVLLNLQKVMPWRLFYETTPSKTKSSGAVLQKNFPK